MYLPIVTRYIQEAGPTPDIGRITLFCTTAPSDPAVKCDAIIRCRNETTVNVQLDYSFVHNTTQPCNITISVMFSENTTTTEILDQVLFSNVIPLVQPTTATPVPTTSIPATSKQFHTSIQVYGMAHITSVW